MKKNNKKEKENEPRTYIDSDEVYTEGSKSSKESNSERRKKALDNLKNKVDTQLVKTASERGIAAEKSGDEDTLKKALKRLKMLKSK